MDKLVESYKEKPNIKYLASLFNRSPQAIRNKLKETGVYKPPMNWTKEELDGVVKQFKEGKTIKELAELYKRTNESIVYKLQDASVIPNVVVDVELVNHN